MSKFNRLNKLEILAKEKKKAAKRNAVSTIDYSTYTDEELNAAYQVYRDESDRELAIHNPYEGMTDQQLSDLYMQTIKADNLK